MCGILGVYSPAKNNVSQKVMLGLFAEQHRGQESCGMAITNGEKIDLYKGMGLVKEVFTPDVLSELTGHIAIGHVRYPTRGSSTNKNSQPHVVETLFGPTYALASNGDIVNYHDIRKYLEDKGVFFKSTNDGELILRYIVYLVEVEKKSIVSAIKEVIKNFKGAFSTVLLTKNTLYLFRDPYGFRPMSYTRLQDGDYAVASETCALDILNPQKIYEVQPGEIIILDKYGISNVNECTTLSKKHQHCVFEHIYFSRPDSIVFEKSVYKIRKKIGMELALCDQDLNPDIVVPVPDSSNVIALGYAQKKNIPFEFGLIRNHYVGRTFIKPKQSVRDESVSQKFNILPNFFKDKIVVLVDDSIVRGTTLKKLIKIIKSAGAKEVHVRIGSPQVRFSCYYGIDTPTNNELIANTKSLEEINDYIGADSIKHLKEEKLKKVIQEDKNYCFACFNGEYFIK